MVRAVDLFGDFMVDDVQAVLEEFGEVEQDGEEDHNSEASVGLLINEIKRGKLTNVYNSHHCTST